MREMTVSAEFPIVEEDDYPEYQCFISNLKGNNLYAHHQEMQSSTLTKVVLIDPRPLIQRLSLSHLLEEASSAGLINREVLSIFPFSSTEEFLSKGCHSFHEVRLVILSIDQIHLKEEEVCREICQIKSKLSDIPLVIIADDDEPHSILEVFRYGAKGYIPTTLSLPVIILALRLIHAGGSFIPVNSFMRLLLQEQSSKQKQPNGFKLNFLKEMTPRQLEILELLRQGKSNKVIAYELDVQENTIKSHVHYIMGKLGATNRTHAVFLASCGCVNGRMNAGRTMTGT